MEKYYSALLIGKLIYIDVKKKTSNFIVQQRLVTVLEHVQYEEKEKPNKI